MKMVLLWGGLVRFAVVTTVAAVSAAGVAGALEMSHLEGLVFGGLVGMLGAQGSMAIWPCWRSEKGV